MRRSRHFDPEVVVHTAAMGDVDACERHPEVAHRVNTQGTEAIARAAVAVGARLISISTDQVYDGVKGQYDEADVPQPLMVYGRSKLEGERRAAAICPPTVILRLALMYGWGSSSRLNFVDWLVQRLRAGQEVPLFTDQVPYPTLRRPGSRSRWSAHRRAGGPWDVQSRGRRTPQSVCLWPDVL